MSFQEAISQSVLAFSQTIQLKLDQFHDVAPKGSNPALAGDFIEELVRGFIRDWIRPCTLLRGTMSPTNLNPTFANPAVPQIDGIVFDPRRGPSIIREGNFIVAHPQFCPGIIEIKKSCQPIQGFQSRLQSIHEQYYQRGTMTSAPTTSVIGIVIHDADPVAHSKPDWLTTGNPSLYKIHFFGTCPIFILFKEVDPGIKYEPHFEAISAMIELIFQNGWSSDPGLAILERQLQHHRIVSRYYS